MRVRGAAAVLLTLAAIALTGCSAPDPLAGGPARTEVVEILRDDVHLAGTLEVPKLTRGETVPLVILMHGYESWSDEPHLVRTAEQLADEGIASLRVDFTGQGLSEGELGEFTAETVSTQLADAQAIYDYASALGYVSDISVLGYSFGGLVAAMFAGEHPDVASLVLLAPAPAYGIYLPVMDTAAKYEGPVLILQGDSDRLVTVSVAEGYRDALADSELRVLEHENHNFTYGTDVEGMAVEFIAAHSTE